MNYEMSTIPPRPVQGLIAAPTAQPANKEWSPAAKLQKFVSRPALKKGFERRRARTLNPVNKADAYVQTVLRDTVHAAKLGREKLEVVTRATDWVFGTKRVRRDEGYGGIYETFAKGKSFDVERMGAVGCVAAGTVVVTVAPAYALGALAGFISYPVARTIKPDEWGEKVAVGGWMHKCGKKAAVVPAVVAIPLAEGMTEVSAVGGAVPKIAIASVCGAFGATTGAFHGIRESRRVEERARPTLGFGL